MKSAFISFITFQLLIEEIEPKLNKLRTERAQYIEFQKVSRDIEYLTRIYISHKYIQYKKSVENCEKSVVNITDFIEKSKQKIVDNEAESTRIDDQMKAIEAEIDTQSGGKLDDLEKELSKRSKEEATANGSTKSASSELDMENRKLKALEKSIKDDEIVLKTKQNQMDKVGGLFESLKQADEADSKAYAESQKRFEAISSGKSVNEDGEASSLQAQLIAAKQQISEANTAIQQSDIELKYATRQLNEKKSESQCSDAAYLKDKKTADHLEKEIHNLKVKLYISSDHDRQSKMLMFGYNCSQVCLPLILKTARLNNWNRTRTNYNRITEKSVASWNAKIRIVSNFNTVIRNRISIVGVYEAWFVIYLMCVTIGTVWRLACHLVR